MSELISPGFVPPPRADELITDDGEPLESNRHRLQANLLVDPLELAWAGREDYFVGANMFLYYSSLQAKKNDFRGPDVFVVLGTERRDRKAWIIWDEDGKHPDVVIELTSDSTREVDHGVKKRIYGAVIGVPEYFIYDPFTAELEGFRFDAVALEYRPIPPAASGRLPSGRLDLELGVWSGRHLELDGPWLRWFQPGGAVLATPREAQLEAARQRDEAARQRDEAARRLDEEHRRREDAEARLKELTARLAALEGKDAPG